MPISHDTALYLSKGNYNSEDGSYDLICTRKDKESVVDWNIDALGQRRNTALKNGDKKTRRILVEEMEYVPHFKIWVNLVAGAHKVFTDRLHVGILSAILGKDTFLYPNFYHKNKGVYEYSLHKFPNVRFINSPRFEQAHAPQYFGNS